MHKDARYVAACAAACAFALAYALADACALPAPLYYPIDHRWTWSRGPGTAMAWYGHVLAAAAVSVVVLAIARAALGRRPPAPRVVTAASIAVAVGPLAAITVTLAHLA
jgi:hypothetical protein